MKNLAYDSLQDAMAGVLKECDKTSLPDLYALPYSRFSAEDSSTWWLRTDKHPTAFKHGKFIVAKGDRFGQDGGVIVGLHVERGVKQESGHPTWKLSRDWKWHDFVGDMAEAVPDALERACHLVGHPMKVALSVSADSKNIDRICFDSSGTALMFLPSESTFVLCEASAGKKCANWRELYDFLSGLKVDWHWVDICIFAPFSLRKDARNEADVAAKMLLEFKRWLGP